MPVVNASLPEREEPQKDDELALLRTGDPAASSSFVRDHISWMLAVAHRILRDGGHAEDAVQSAFARIFANLKNFEGRASLKTWMHRIVVNEALAVFRKNRPQKDEPIDDLLPAFDDNGCRVEAPLASFVTPESLLQQSQTTARVAELIEKLPDSYRVVVVLRDIEEMATSEVAEALGLSEANVKVRLHRARAALKKLLEPLIRGQEL